MDLAVGGSGHAARPSERSDRILNALWTTCRDAQSQFGLARERHLGPASGCYCGLHRLTTDAEISAFGVLHWSSYGITIGHVVIFFSPKPRCVPAHSRKLIDAVAGREVKMASFYAILERWRPYVLSILRIVAALLFLQSGLSKFFGFPAAGPLSQA